MAPSVPEFTKLASLMSEGNFDILVVICEHFSPDTEGDILLYWQKVCLHCIYVHPVQIQ